MFWQRITVFSSNLRSQDPFLAIGNTSIWLFWVHDYLLYYVRRSRSSRLLSWISPCSRTVHIPVCKCLSQQIVPGTRTCTLFGGENWFCIIYRTRSTTVLRVPEFSSWDMFNYCTVRHSYIMCTRSLANSGSLSCHIVRTNNNIKARSFMWVIILWRDMNHLSLAS
jgi:hypothetical protein